MCLGSIVDGWATSHSADADQVVMLEGFALEQAKIVAVGSKNSNNAHGILRRLGPPKGELRLRLTMCFEKQRDLIARRVMSSRSLWTTMSTL